MVGKKDYCCYWSQIQSQGWNSNSFHGYFDGCPCGNTQTANVERFYGCSDVAVVPGGPTPAPTTAAPTPAPTTAAPAPAPPPPPAPPPTPTTAAPTPAPAPNCCKWASNCGGSCASGWCSSSQTNCGGCGG